MAFNPVHYFRKYQRFWMASVLMMCMVTFVLCTGMQGGLEDWFLRTFRWNKGSVIAEIDGRNYYHQDFADIKAQRQMANEFMRKMCEKCIVLADKKIEKLLEDKGGEEKVVRAKIMQADNIRAVLDERLKRKQFFDGGMKLDDLVDFKVWLLEADRLGITLDSEGITRLVLEIEFQFRTTGLTYDDMLITMGEVSRAQGSRSAKAIWQSLMNEYRVQMAKLAMMTCDGNANLRDKIDPFTLRHLVPRRPFETSFDPIPLGRGSPYSFSSLRVPVAPAQIWDFYNEKRLEFEVAMVPVLAEDFFAKVSEPTEDDLQRLFQEYRKKRYDHLRRFGLRGAGHDHGVDGPRRAGNRGVQVLRKRGQGGPDARVPRTEHAANPARRRARQLRPVSGRIDR